MSSNSILDKLANIQNIKAKWLYAMLIIGILIPTLYPIGLPVVLTEPALNLYTTIDSLPEGSIILFAADIVPGCIPEVYGAMLAIMQHMFSLEGIKIIFTHAWMMGDVVLAQGMNEVYGGPFNVPGKVYGVDYIFMPWVPGGESFVAALAKDPSSVFSVDFYNNPVAELPLFAELQSGEDFAFVMELVIGSQYTWYLRHFNAQYGTKIGMACMAYIYSSLMPYYTTEQIVGYLVGIKGAGEYEILVGRPGVALRGTDALSTSYLWILAVVLIGNTARGLKKMSGEKVN